MRRFQGSHVKRSVSLVALGCKAVKNSYRGTCWPLDTAGHQVLPDPGAAEAWRGAYQNQDGKPHLLQCPSSVLCWQSITTFQLAKAKYSRASSVLQQSWPWRTDLEMWCNKLRNGTTTFILTSVLVWTVDYIVILIIIVLRNNFL